MTTRRALLPMALIVGALAWIPPAMSDPRPARIAFADTGNTGRSVTAEALAVAAIAKAGLRAQVISRAVNQNPYNLHPEPNFVTLLSHRGIDIASHAAQQFGLQDAVFSDVILVMTLAHKDWIAEHFPQAKDKVFTLSEYVSGTHQDIPDAFGKPMEFYETVLARLDGLVGAAVAKAAAAPR